VRRSRGQGDPQATVGGAEDCQGGHGAARQHDLEFWPICEQVVVAFVRALSTADQVLRILMERKLASEKR